MTAHVGLNGMTLPPASLPMATNCCVVVTGNVIGVGVSVIDASGPGVTVIDARPEIPPTEATTVLANEPATRPAENTPLGLIVPPFATTDHVGDISTARPSASKPSATIC